LVRTEEREHHHRYVEKDADDRKDGKVTHPPACLPELEDAMHHSF
jgi:hypothetical protein